MAAPNIVNVSSIIGKTAQVNLTTTSATQVLSNAASSNHVYKVGMIMVANKDGVNSCNITINLYSQDDIGGTPLPIASTISVPPNATMIIIDKNTSFYLEEDKSIGATAENANDLVVTIAYEDIS